MAVLCATLGENGIQFSGEEGSIAFGVGLCSTCGCVVDWASQNVQPRFFREWKMRMEDCKHKGTNKQTNQTKIQTNSE